MCRVIGFLETPLTTRQWYWVQLDCGMYLKAPLGADGYSGYWKGFGGQDIACPVHQPDEWAARKFSNEAAKFGDRHSVDIEIGN